MENAECAVCFDALAKLPVSVFLSGARKRTCRHYFHSICIEALKQAGQMVCPCCRTPYENTVELPDIEKNPRGWFTCVDFDGNQTLDRQEVIEVLKATLLIDFYELERKLPEMFNRWDVDHDGTVSYDEMVREGGIVDYAKSFPPAFEKNPPPCIRTSRQEWFDYWDEDKSGGLDMEEILRAFVKTFNLQDTVAQAIMLRSILECLWDEIDPDGSGAVDYAEFSATNGLADMVLANMGW